MIPTKKDTLILYRNHIFLVLCLLVHIFFLIYFFSIGVPILGIMNCISSIIYVILLVLFRHTGLFAISITYIEIMLFSITNTTLIGLGSGYFLYLIGILVLSYSVYQETKKLRTLFQILASFLFLLSLPLSKITSLVIEDIRMDVSGHMNFILFCNMVITVVCILFLSITNSKEIEMAQERLKFVSEHDELTQLYNRSYIRQYFNEHRRRDDRRFSVIMLDIDDFKSVNDTFGHEAGDSALKYLAHCLSEMTRKDDMVVRWGGEEFLIFLKGCPLDKAIDIAEEIRESVCAQPYTKRKVPLFMTITLGVSALVDNESYEKAINRADALLYQGKQCGKNIVMSEKNSR